MGRLVYCLDSAAPGRSYPGGMISRGLRLTDSVRQLNGPTGSRINSPIFAMAAAWPKRPKRPKQ